MNFHSKLIKLFLVVFFLLSPLVFSETYYVKSDGDDSTTGTSWQTAFKTITKALNVAEAEDQIWVAEGTYQKGNTITISGGISVYGGFAGTETSLEQRNISKHPTIIDGENKDRCVYNYGDIDGFYIKNGRKNYNVGGGIYNYYGTVTNCTLYSNSADNGGGIANDYGTVTNCTLYSNSAENYGGGIYNYYGTVTNCTLYSNSAYYGGGIYNDGTVTNCISWKNVNRDISEYPDIKTYFSCYGDALNENGNIKYNPLFMNTSGDPSTWDFHLQNGSPCIDTGTTDTSQLPDQDIEGNPRPGADGKVCMGAYESPDHYIPLPPEPPTRIYVSKSGNNNDGSSWEDAYTSITKALLSLPGDNIYEIWVKEGIYQEEDTIDIPGRVHLCGGFVGTETFFNERIISEYRTIIDGKDTYRCVRNYGVIDGFYVRNGRNSYSGGGIYINHGIVTNCILYSNTADYYGGGILNLCGIVTNCILYSNTAANEGGGIYNDYGTATSCTLSSNSAANDGGGIYNYYGTATGCTLSSNSAANGGGIYNYYGTVINCILFSNSVDYDGGGIENFYGTVTNCILYSNSADRRGGGIYNDYGTVTNCTLYSNSAYYGGGISNYGTVTNCISWKNVDMDISGNTGKTYFSCYSEFLNGNGNIRANPLFMNTSGDPSTWDFHLQNGSPCIDVGTTDTAQLPDKDIEGNPRPGGDGKVCMGAYESPDHYISLPPPPPDWIYVSKSGNNSNGGSWEDAYTSITIAFSSITGDNMYEVWVKEGLYQEGDTIYIPGRVDLYGSFAGKETYPEERNLSEYHSIIDGKDIHQCVYNHGTIDGFYVTKGYALKNSGGGILNDHGTVTNCSLFSNSADGNGGGIFNYYGIVDYCTLYSNSSDHHGGGISNHNGTVANSTLSSNSAANDGGGIDNNYGTVTKCILYSNSSDYGGGIDNYYGTVTNCTLSSNSAASNGGGVYIFYGSLYNCIICSNSNWGIYCSHGGIVNSTLYNNEGGILNSGTVMNCISWENGASDIEGGTVTYSCFKEATGTNGNINADPLFIKLDGNLSSWVFQLKNGSPCIDAGNPDEAYNDGCLPPGKGDLRNDMGAYGGPYNCNWGINIGKSDFIDFLTGKKTLSGLEFPFADKNSDDKVDAADLIYLILH